MENSSPNPSFSICDIRIQKRISRSFGKSLSSPKNSFAKTSSALKPHALPEYLEGKTPKEKHPFLFQEKIHPRQIRNARSVFSFGVAGVLASVRGFLGAYALVSSHHALRACDIICFENRCALRELNPRPTRRQRVALPLS